MIGYCVPILPQLASYRLRVVIPSRHLGMPYRIGQPGDVTFMFKEGNPELARRLGPVVYDVVNAHFDNAGYREMCEIADAITCSSPVMAEMVKAATGRDAVVIPDPWENAESAPAVQGERVLWFGHQANIASLKPYADLDLDICTARHWSLEAEAAMLEAAGVVLLTGNNPGASGNRVVKAIRAGRFVVAPHDCPASWRELEEFCWIGDVRDGIRWAFANREEACWKVTAGQEYVRTRFSPQSIGSRWADVFNWTSAQATSTRQAGCVSISR